MAKGYPHRAPPSAILCLIWFALSFLHHCWADTVVLSEPNDIYEVDDSHDNSPNAPMQLKLHTRHHRQAATQPETVLNETITDNHSYYTSRCFKAQTGRSVFWVDLDDPSIIGQVEAPASLSTTARKGTNIHLKFQFPFYGHNISSLVITTGGFIYTGSYIHSHLAATQYIAPLMGNFSPSQSPTAGVRFYDNGTALTVEWREQYLTDNIPAGIFTFQATLCDNGRIIFAYKQIPIPVSSISDVGHPVKVGLADAYYMDIMISTPFTKKREIYEYHSVELDVSQIGNGTAILLIPLPTCNQLISCTTCMSSDVVFNCTWCEKLGRCSDGMDRKRQTWIESGCSTSENYIDMITECPGYTPPPPTEAPPLTSVPAVVKDQPTHTVQAALGTSVQPTKKLTPDTTDYCKDIRCLHGGLCEDGLCNCPRQFEGARCQKYATLHCQDAICENGGSCLEGITTHLCDCKPGYSGKYCDVEDIAVKSQSSGNQGLTVGAIVCIALISLLVVCLFVWAVYAYRHPTSPSGLFILETKHRLKGRGRGSNGVKYKYHQQMESNQVDIEL